MRKGNFLAAMILFFSVLSRAMDDERPLPSEIWINIFSFLHYQNPTNFIFVSKGWRDIFINEDLWRLHIRDSNNISAKPISWRFLAWAISKPTKIAIAGEQSRLEKKNPAISFVNIEVVEISGFNTFNRNDIFRDCIKESPHVICFPFFLSSHESRCKKAAADSIVGDLLTEALEKDIVVVMRNEPLPLQEYPNVIRVISANFWAYTPSSSVILNMETEDFSCSIEKISLLIAKFRSMRRDLSAQTICQILEKSSSQIPGHENIRVKKINEDAVLSAILAYEAVP